MKTRWAVLWVFGLASLGAFALGVSAKDEKERDEEEQEVSLQQVPPAARTALLKFAGGAKITEVEREKKHGVTFYEAEWQVDGREHEAKVTADGDLMELEVEVDAKDVPAVVRRAAEKTFPGGAKLEYERKTVILYEIECKVGGKEREVLLTPAGKAVLSLHD
jgi:uncharacterized membrane protein YkoI